MWNKKDRKAYSVLLFVVHEGSNGSAGVSAITGLTVNTNSGTTNAEMVDGAGDSTRRGRHCMTVM